VTDAPAAVVPRCRAGWARPLLMRRALSAALVSLVAGACVTREARGDDCFPTTGLGGCVDSDELWPRLGPTPFLSIGPASTTPEGRVWFGLAMSYAKRPIVLRAAGPDPEGRDLYLVDNLLDGTFLLALGVTNRLELTLDVPMTFYEDGAGVGALDGSDVRLPRSAIRDGRFGFAYTFVRPPEEPRRVSFALVGRFDIAAPYGAGDAFARSQTATLAPTLMADLRVGRFDIASELGARLRGESTLGTTGWGSSVTVSVGVSARVWDRAKLDVAAEAFAMPALLAEPSGQILAPSEWLVDVTTAPLLGGDLSFGISGGGAIPLSPLALTAPLYRLSSVIRYAPTGRPPDRDPRR
jgi:hypothetical protein